MIRTTLYSSILVASFSLANPALAQAPHPMPMTPQQMQNHSNMMMPSAVQMQPMQRPAFAPPATPDYPSFADFPTPEELARMTPPEALSEDNIKQRFAQRRARMEQVIAHDRKEAEKYAKDFARYQRFQAEKLAEIMARAEKQREAMLNRIIIQEQHALEKFNQQNNATATTEPTQY